MVALLVAVRVVEALEVVQVDDRHRDDAARAGGRGQRARQGEVPGAAVGDAGQAVAVGECLELGGLVLHLPDERPHARQDEGEEQQRAGGHPGPVDVRGLAEPLGDEHAGGHRRGEPEQ
jgi:hypothetical protein